LATARRHLGWHCNGTPFQNQVVLYQWQLAHPVLASSSSSSQSSLLELNGPGPRPSPKSNSILYHLISCSRNLREHSFLDFKYYTDALPRRLTQSYARGGSSLKDLLDEPRQFARAIFNHAPIGSCRARPFPRVPCHRPCETQSLESCEHDVLTACPLYRSHLSNIDDWFQLPQFMERNPTANPPSLLHSVTEASPDPVRGYSYISSIS
jgi:hypothetical protein